jgi:hypothetical protein
MRYGRGRPCPFLPTGAAVLPGSVPEALDTAVLRGSAKRAAPAGVSLRPGTAVSIACDRRCCWSVNESGDESGSRLPSVVIRSDRNVAPPAFRFLSLSLAAPLSPTEYTCQCLRSRSSTP